MKTYHFSFVCFLVSILVFSCPYLKASVSSDAETAAERHSLRFARLHSQAMQDLCGSALEQYLMTTILVAEEHLEQNCKTEKKIPFMTQEMPLDAVLLILSHLDPQALYALSKTCNSMLHVVYMGCVWRKKTVILNQHSLAKYKAATNPFPIKVNSLIHLIFEAPGPLVEYLLDQVCVEGIDEILTNAVNCFAGDIVSVEVDHGNSNLSALGMQAIARCTNLQRLKVSCTQIDDDAFSRIQGMLIRSLDINTSLRLSPEGACRTLATLSQLEELNLSRIKFTDPLLSQLREKLILLTTLKISQQD